MAKNIPFFLGCLLGTEATNPKAVHPYDAAMGLWNLALDADTRADIEGAGDVIQVVVDLVMKGTAGEAMTPCIGMLEPLAMSDNEETKATIQKSVTTLIGRYDTYAQEHSASETKSIFGVLSSLSRNRRAAALMIADRMLKPSMLRGLINWVEKEIQASNVNFMAALSTCPELHPRLLVHLNMDLALKIMAEQGNKRAAHAALDYMGELAKNGDYTAEVRMASRCLLEEKKIPHLLSSVCC